MAENNITAEREWPNDRRNSAPFFEALQQIVNEKGQPELIIVGLGPGSYTGTRIAISAAMGLKLTTGAKLCGLPSIAALSDKNDFAVIGDAKRSAFFFAQGHRLEANTTELLSESEMHERIAETGVPIYTSDELPQFVRAKLCFPSAKRLCQLAEKFPRNLIRAPLTPIYLREPHITQPREK